MQGWWVHYSFIIWMSDQTCFKWLWLISCASHDLAHSWPNWSSLATPRILSIGQAGGEFFKMFFSPTHLKDTNWAKTVFSMPWDHSRYFDIDSIHITLFCASFDWTWLIVKVELILPLFLKATFWFVAQLTEGYSSINCTPRLSSFPLLSFLCRINKKQVGLP